MFCSFDRNKAPIGANHKKHFISIRLHTSKQILKECFPKLGCHEDSFTLLKALWTFIPKIFYMAPYYKGIKILNWFLLFIETFFI